MVLSARLLTALAGVAVLFSSVCGKDYRVTIAPVEFDRSAQVVMFKLPADASRATGLKQGSGEILPLQIAGGQAVFVVPAQKAGETLSFSLVSDGKTPPSIVEAKTEKGRL